MEVHQKGSTMDGNTPLVPQYYPSVQIQRKEVAVTQPLASAPAIKPTCAQTLLLGPENTLCECPFCSASIKTAVRYSTTSRTHIAAALCCLFCLCCVPYASDSAKNTDHYCPSCHRYLGTYEK